jgi:hypothetical protein
VVIIAGEFCASSVIWANFCRARHSLSADAIDLAFFTFASA